jgi:hypothetical protein
MKRIFNFELVETRPQPDAVYRSIARGKNIQTKDYTMMAKDALLIEQMRYSPL